MTLHGRLVTLRPLALADAALVAEIQRQPGIARWWGDEDEASYRRKVPLPDGEAFVIELDGETVGFIEYHEEDDPEFRRAGIDLFVADHLQGRGLGTDAVRTLAAYLFEERDHHRLTIDPALDNAAAIRSYEKVGFRRVGVMREYWRDADGVWRDGLLMDLLAQELSAG